MGDIGIDNSSFPGAPAAAVAVSRTGDKSCLLPQTRGVELRLPPSFQDDDAPRLVWLAKRAGFNTILLNCFSGGRTVFRSSTMLAHGFPAQEPRFSGSDPVTAVLEAARREGLAIYALVEGLAVGGGARRRGPILGRRPEWGVRGRNDRKPAVQSRFLCPANREVWRFLGDLFYEIVERYPLQGLYVRHLHYPLTLPGQTFDYCWCNTCRPAVWHSLGVKIEEIPDDPNHPDRYNVTSWRTKQLAALVRHIRLRLGKSCSPALIVAETYLAEEGAQALPETCGFQDGCQWAQDRLISIAALRPLPGTVEQCERWVRRVAAMAQWSLVMPVISAAQSPGLAETIERLTAHPICGIVVREPHDLTAPPLTNLSQNIWREPARVCEDRPLLSVCALLERSARRLPLGNPVRAFLNDVLRVVRPFGDQWPSPQRQTLYDNLQGLEERIADEKIPLGSLAPTVLRDFCLARQLLRLAEIES